MASPDEQQIKRTEKVNKIIRGSLEKECSHRDCMHRLKLSFWFEMNAMRHCNSVPYLVICLGCLCFGELCMSCTESERNSLLMFKTGLQDPLQLLSSWTGEDCCAWRGVECSNTSMHVVKLDLRYHHLFHGLTNGGRLGGEINPSLLGLQHLNYLDLSFNNFRGTEIPSFIGSLSGLTYLNLSNAGFNGGIPPQLGNLSSLSYLDLNSFYSMYALYSGSLQWLSSLSSLQYLDMSGVNLAIVSSDDLFHAFNMLPVLSVLILPNCQLHLLSPSSHSFLNLSRSSLTSIDLSNNQINSTFPFWLTNCSRLVHLDLWLNHFHGVIPEAIGNMKSLEVIQLGLNDFVGPLPTSIRDLCNLHTLDISFNNLGEETSTLSRIFSGCAGNTIETLNLRNSNLRGELSGWLGKLKGITILDLGNNSLYGPIPASIGNLSNLRILYLTYNGLNGTLPESIGQLSELKVLEITCNSLTGVISEAHFANLSSLESVSMSSNSLVVNISRDWLPPFRLIAISFGSVLSGAKISRMAQNTERFLHAKFAKYWNYRNLFGKIGIFNLRSNKFKGPLPPLPLDAIYVDLSDNSFSVCKFRRLQVIDISSNSIFGELPTCWENLPALEALNLENNSLTGEIPSSIGSLKFMQTLLRITCQELYPKLFSNFTAMKLANEGRQSIMDGFRSQVITSLGNYSRIGYADSLSVVTKGRELKYSNTLQFVASIDLSSNWLSGEIPEQLGNLQGIQNLNLSGNHLAGRIPESINGLKSLESLDLSRNELVGEIPSSIAALTSLSHLNLSYNNLSGRIPSGSQLQTFNDPSTYIGNYNLCGPPLTVKCGDVNETIVLSKEGDDANESEMSWLYFGGAVGYVMGLWTVCVTLLISEAWRNSYFSLVDYINKKFAALTSINCSRNNKVEDETNGGSC
ncbi:receptor-like protein EIX1 [Dioscorea cayenensis subsp. rotundata]|uniref:Receptor-like protein EIX1 n=1 Tax=Dioscorea cayennensis subsp. rotundata TaxID=55577 RepID=A0AB40C4U9_DIOCR|nr:receptor-like protein EIX1 [Dioscorea cayenensis subsp. rotundata]